MASSKPLLTYFDGRGLAEVSRLALSALQIEFDEVDLQTRDQFLQLIEDGKLPYKQVPLLEFDGRSLVGSEVILRHLCRKGNLMGKTEADQDQVELLFMGAKDMRASGWTGYTFQKTPEDQEKTFQNAIKQSKERYLPVFEKVLAESKSGFLVGDSLTMADLQFFDAVTHMSDNPKAKPELANFPHCRAFIDHVSKQPGIKEHLSSARRFPPPDQAFAKKIMTILNF